MTTLFMPGSIFRQASKRVWISECCAGVISEVEASVLELDRSRIKGSDAQSQREMKRRVRRKAVCGVEGTENGNGLRKLWAARSSRRGSGRWRRRRWDEVHFLRRRVVAERTGKRVHRFAKVVV